jgi:hypothetical protein
VAEWLDLDAKVKDAGVYVYEAGFHPATTAKAVSRRRRTDVAMTHFWPR